jgi:hypothetical protein
MVGWTSHLEIHPSYTNLILLLRAIQAGGFGRSAMHQVERLASLPPLNATTMALDTVTKEYQQTPEGLATFNELRGQNLELKDFRTSEGWYLRQGYEEIARIKDMYKWVHPQTGTEVMIPSVFLKKDLV